MGGDGIILYGSNDPEELIARCAEDLQVPLSNPFVKEEFLVQSRAMNSWIKLQLADRLGIFANAQFRFPEETIWMILRAFLGEGPERNPYTKEGMAWKIFDLLPGFLEREKKIFSNRLPVMSNRGRIMSKPILIACFGYRGKWRPFLIPIRHTDRR